MLRLEASWQAADDTKQRHEDTTQEIVLPFYISNKKRKNDTNENVSSSDDDNDNDDQKAMLLKTEDDEEAAAEAELEEEETALESLVFGSSTSNLMANIDKIKKMKKKLKTNEKKTIVEQMIESEDTTLLGLKPAWQDVDDNEM